MVCNLPLVGQSQSVIVQVRNWRMKRKMETMKGKLDILQERRDGEGMNP